MFPYCAVCNCSGHGNTWTEETATVRDRFPALAVELLGFADAMKVCDICVNKYDHFVFIDARSTAAAAGLRRRPRQHAAGARLRRLVK